VATLRRQLFGRLLDQPIGFFVDRKAGDLLSRINTDIDGIDDVVTDTVFGLVSSALTTAATLALMVRFSWQLTLAVLVMIPAVAFPARRAGKASYRARSATQQQRGHATAYLQEILGVSGIMLVKAFGQEAGERRRFAAMTEDLRALEVRQNLIGQWFGMLMSTLQNAGPALMIFFGGWLAPVPALQHVFGHDIGLLWFLLKMGAGLFFFIWLRGTVPRFRYDQLMNFGWKVLLPLATLNILATAAWIAFTK